MAGNLIHRSDRGIQYYSNQYVNQLKKRNIQTLMTEGNHCYENVVAERVNGILKDEFPIGEWFNNTLKANKRKNVQLVFTATENTLNFEH